MDIQSAAHNLYLACWPATHAQFEHMKWAITKNGLYHAEINGAEDFVLLNIGENALTLEMCPYIRILYIDDDVTDWDLWTTCIQKAAETSLEKLTIKLPSFTAANNGNGDSDVDLNDDYNLTNYHLLLSRLIANHLTCLELINSDRELVFGTNFPNLADVVYTDCIFSAKWIDSKESRIAMNNWQKNDINEFLANAKSRQVHSQLLTNLPADNAKPIADLSEMDEVLMQTADGNQFRYFNRESASLASNDLAWIEEVLVALFNENQPDEKKVKTIKELGIKADGGDDKSESDGNGNERKGKADRINMVYIDQLFIDASATPNDKMKLAVFRILRAIKSLRFLRITTTSEAFYNETIKTRRLQMDVEITLKSANGEIKAQSYVSYPKKYLLTNKLSVINAQFAGGPWTHVALQIEDESLVINTVDEGMTNVKFVDDLNICKNLQFIAIQSNSWQIHSDIMTAIANSFAAPSGDFANMEGVMVYNENISVSMTKAGRVEVVLRTTIDLEKNLRLIPRTGRDYCFDIQWGIVGDKFVKSGYDKYEESALELMSCIEDLTKAQSLDIAGNVSLFFEFLAKHSEGLKLGFKDLVIEYLRIITPVMCDELSAAHLFPKLNTVLLNATPVANIYFAMVEKLRLDLINETKEKWHHIGQLSAGIGYFSAISKVQTDLVMEYCQPQPKMLAHTVENEFARQRHTFGGKYTQNNE